MQLQCLDLRHCNSWSSKCDHSLSGRESAQVSLRHRNVGECLSAQWGCSLSLVTHLPSRHKKSTLFYKVLQTTWGSCWIFPQMTSKKDKHIIVWTVYHSSPMKWKSHKLMDCEELGIIYNNCIMSSSFWMIDHFYHIYILIAYGKNSVKTGGITKTDLLMILWSSLVRVRSCYI